MTLKQARRELEKVGFKFDPRNKVSGVLKFGTMPAEPYTNDLIKNNYWVPNHRSVFIAHAIDGPYITSSIHGKYRRYKVRKYNEYNREFGNIFGYGKTLAEAVTNFLNNFNSKIYNVAK